MKKKILFGLFHIPHVNFFKNSIKMLEDLGHDCTIYVRPRGDLLPILKHELGTRKIIQIGRHYKSDFGKITETINSDLKLLLYLSQEKFDVVTSIAGLSLCHASYLRNIPSVTFSDDPEYNFLFSFYSRYSSKLVSPIYCDVKGENTISYNGYKELAYLHPNFFSPSKEVLERYNLEPDNFVLIREQAPISLVYRDARIGQLYEIAKDIKELGFKVLMSLEDKTDSSIYKGIGEVLTEPVDSFHSLLHYAKFVVSSGDSLSREAALLGTPAVYTGGRVMKVNKELIQMGLMFKEESYENIKKICLFLEQSDYKRLIRKRLDKKLRDEWVETSTVITETLLNMAI